MALWCVAASGAVQMCAGFHFWMCRYGCSFLEAMLRKLKVLGISVWLDMHALPGGAQARVPYGGVYYPDSQVPPSPRHASLREHACRRRASSAALPRERWKAVLQ